MTSRSLLGGALALAACTSQRQLVLSIDTTAGVPCDIDRIRLVATATGTTTVEQSLKGARLPVSITLLDDTPNGSFEVDIVALKGEIEVMHARGPLQFTSDRDVEAVLLEPTCTAAAPCAVADAIAAAAAPAAPAAECGANVTRYSASAGLDSHQEACTVPGAMHVLDDGSAAPVRLMSVEPALLDAGFQFYGRPIRQIWVSKDGYLSFTKDSPDPGTVILPGPFDRDIERLGLPPPRQSVMAFWDSLTLSSAGVCYALVGATRNRQLLVTWAGACLATDCGSDDLNFTIMLEESTQRIAFTYGKMSAGNDDRARGLTATVGLVNDATGCPSYECTLETGLCQDGRTPCGYSQVFSNTRQDAGVQRMQFMPIIDP
jgi:hypothetical protein